MRSSILRSALVLAALICTLASARPAAAARAADWGDATPGHYINGLGLQATDVTGIAWVTKETGDVVPHPTAFEPVKLKIGANYVTVDSWAATNHSATSTSVSFYYKFGVHAGGNKDYKFKVTLKGNDGMSYTVETPTAITRQCPH